ncbi:family 18 glycosyltransferase [Phakopsora pachyrhizi]|uniref:Family 18 glycosyltransferase n=1 Tax=Phakopsora pachyrhizi TaxID=170000 RepID=A0AAV0B171_PHAPC|nr:family 18 glycosyltransferase [Phakopsora pachyrhizi]
MVIGDYLSVPKCLKDEKDCIRSRVDPSGIPSHKLFVFDGYDVGHPLGRRWHLSFYPKLEEGFSFLGLTIEHYCKNFSVVPPKLRPKKIYILGKDRGYFYPPSPQLFKRDMWKRISDKTGIGFTMGTFQRSKEIDEQRQKNDTSGYEKAKKFADFEPIEGIDDIGTQTRSQFIYQIQNHRAVIGLGWPVQPSTPLEALCVGTPFINPVWVGRRSQPDRSKWHSQHPYLAHFDPPFVYNVQDQREDDILESIEMILKKPLEGRFIPDELKIESYLNRLKDLVEFDWKELSLQKNNKKK